MVAQTVTSFLLACCLLNELTPTLQKKIKSYHLYKHLPLSEPNCSECPITDCVYYDLPFKLPRKMTMCYRWSFDQVTSSNLFSFIITLGKIRNDWKYFTEQILFGVWKSPWLGVRLKSLESINWLLVNKETYISKEWVHTCIGFNFDTGNIRLVENGHTVFDKDVKSFKQWMQNVSGDNFDTVTLGCTPRSEGSRNMTAQGKITDFQLWNELLIHEKMIAYTTCEDLNLNGSMVSWEDTDWKLLNKRGFSSMEFVDIENEVCLKMNNSYILLPTQMLFYEQAVPSCDKFSGQVAGYVTEEKFNIINSFLSFNNRYSVNCHSTVLDKLALIIWVAVTDSKVEGLFAEYYTNKKIKYQPWMDGRPTKEGYNYNCIVNSHFFDIADNQNRNVSAPVIYDELCSKKLCTLCEVKKNQEIYVRGLCKESPFDREFKFVINSNGLPLYIGRTSSSIAFDKETEQWIWRNRLLNESTAVSPASLHSFLLGSTTIHFSKKTDVCLNGKSEQFLKVKLTTCVDGQYTCGNGQCISLENRCDQQKNCDDGSDEKDCQLLAMTENYNKKLSPIPIDLKTKKSIISEVDVSVVIEKVLKISESEQEYDLKFTLILEWYDNRLKFYNLKTSHSSNPIMSEDLKKLWMPQIVFKNTKRNDRVIYSDEVQMTIMREGNFTQSDDDVAEEVNLFMGSENRIIFESSYTKSFNCEYELQMYPFDLQVCTINMEVIKLERSRVKLVTKAIEMAGKTLLMQYTLDSWKMQYKNDSQHSDGIVVVLHLKRRLINVILTTYFPTVIMLVIVYVTNFFKPFFFEAVVTVNLTSLLVLTTLFISVSSSLLKTSYIKMIDIWLIFAQTIPFIEVLLHTFMDNMLDDEDRDINHHGKPITVMEKTKSNSSSKEKDEKNQKEEPCSLISTEVEVAWVATEVLLPLIVLAFTLVYWAYGLYYYNNPHTAKNFD